MAIAGKVIKIKEIVQQSPKHLTCQPGHVKKGMFITMLEEFPPGRLAGLNQCLAKQTHAIADSVVIDHQKDDQGHPPTLMPQGITDLHCCRYGQRAKGRVEYFGPEKEKDAKTTYWFHSMLTRSRQELF